MLSVVVIHPTLSVAKKFALDITFTVQPYVPVDGWLPNPLANFVYDSTVASNDVATAPFVQSFDNVFAALWFAASIVSKVALPIDLSSNVTSQPPAWFSYAIHVFFLADFAAISVPNVV